MKNTYDEAVKTLNDLIEICKDGEKGFQLAAEREKESDLSQLFSRYSQERAKFAQELRQLVSRFGGNPENSGTVTGAAHRGWIQTKAAVTGDSTVTIVTECERGEDAAMHAYEEALKKELPPEALEVVQRQFAQVREAHDRVRELEIQYKH